MITAYASHGAARTVADDPILVAVRHAPSDLRVRAYTAGLMESRWSSNSIREAEGLPASPTPALSPREPHRSPR